jgi:hypothetical protein
MVVMVASYECLVIGLAAMCLPTQTTSTIIELYIVIKPKISYCPVMYVAVILRE